MFAEIVLVFAFMAKTWDVSEFETYTMFVNGFTEIPVGFVPTGIVSETVFVLPSITETVAEPEFVT
jgi:hypothetical protein